MKFYGIQKTSLVNYPGRISTVLFTRGCNLRCRYCYNRDLVCTTDTSGDPLNHTEALDILLPRTSFIDAVVITGGEPTINDTLPQFLTDIREKTSLLIKLDTNGFRPDVIESLVEKHLVDYVAVDIKTSPEKYTQIAGVEVDTSLLARTITILREYGITYECRTTVVPGFFSSADIDSIRSFIGTVDSYYLQQFVNENTIDTDYANIYPFSKEELTAFCTQIQSFSSACHVRGI
ncbi:MAG: anaerobic ribonucleoside-triphosphate reductase activating protein [Spirochaetota bacterium]